jgi:hypothetical protein
MAVVRSITPRTSGQQRTGSEPTYNCQQLLCTDDGAVRALLGGSAPRCRPALVPLIQPLSARVVTYVAMLLWWACAPSVSFDWSSCWLAGW